MKAFPLDYQWGEEFKGNNGMDLRDYFAAKAMQGMCSDKIWSAPIDFPEITRRSYVIADAMMKAREQ